MLLPKCNEIKKSYDTISYHTHNKVLNNFNMKKANWRYNNVADKMYGNGG